MLIKPILLKTFFNLNINYLLNSIALVVYIWIKCLDTCTGQTLNTHILDTETKISGTFGEFRGNHFHSGTDYKTGKKEGVPVFAADDGYIIRVLVSRSGYGKALYINHKNGITTVYAHLRAFEGEIADTVWKLQKRQKHFELDRRFGHQKIRIQKGQLIGYSGNTGSSEGPHLHFETRHTQTEKPFDPTTVGFTFNDQLPPILNELWIYQLGADSVTYPLPIPKRYEGRTADTIPVAGPFIVGINTFDLAGEEKNQLGIKKTKLYLNDSLIISFEITSFEFHQSKEIIGVIDQGLRYTGQHSFLLHRTRKLTIPFFDEKLSNGILSLAEGSKKRLRIELEDVMGNQNTYTYLLASESKQNQVDPRPKDQMLLKLETDTTFILDEFKVQISANSLLGPSYVKFARMNYPDSRSNSYQFGSPDIPLVKPVKVQFKLDSSQIRSSGRLTIVRLEKNNNITSLGATLKNGWLTAESGTLGVFKMMHDQNAPECDNPTYFEDELTGKIALALELDDDLSGVGAFRCKVNGKWIYSEYYPSRKTLIIYGIEKYKNETLEVKATDKCNNTSRSRFIIEP